MPGGGETKSTVTQSNLPAYAQPFYTNMMQRAMGESFRPYQTYGNERLAGISGDTQSGLNSARAYGNSGTPFLDQGIAGTQDVLGRAPSTYQADAGRFTDPGVRDQYMSPYMQAVVDKAKVDAMKNAQEEQAMRNAEFGRSGAFGGSRAAVQNQMAIGQLQSRLTDIDVEGAQSAFENAQGQYERDRSASFTNRGLNNESMQLQNATAGQLGQMQSMQDDMRLNRIKSLLGVGQTTEDYAQERLDMAYNDFVNQRDIERQNLQFFSSLLQGVPISANQNVTSTTPTNPLAGGLGTLTGLQALYQLRQS